MKYATKLFEGTHPGHRASETLAEHKRLLRKAHNALANGKHDEAKRHLFAVIKGLPRAKDEPVFETRADEAQESPAVERKEPAKMEALEHKPGLSPAMLAYLKRAKAQQARA